MPSPVYEAGVYGNVINDETLKAGAIIAALLDLSNDVEGHLTVETNTLTMVPKMGPLFEVHKVAGAFKSLTQAAPAGSTKLTMNTAAGLHLNESIMICEAMPPYSGEIVKVTTATTDGVSLAITPITGVYQIHDLVCKIVQAPTDKRLPADEKTGTWAAVTNYSVQTELGPSVWCLIVHGGDVDAMVSSTMDKIIAIQ